MTATIQVFFSVYHFPDSDELFFEVVVWKKENPDLGACMCSLCLLAVFGSVKDSQENKLFSRRNYAGKKKEVSESVSYKGDSRLS